MINPTINLHVCLFFWSITTIRIACNVCSHFKIDILLLKNSKDTKCWRNNVITRGSSRKYERGRGLAKGVWKCTRGRGSEGLSVSALFEKFLIIEIVVFPLLIVRVILSKVTICNNFKSIHTALTSLILGCEMFQPMQMYRIFKIEK